MHKRKVKTKRGTKTIIVNKGVTKKARKMNPEARKKYVRGIIRNKMKENKEWAKERMRVNDRLDKTRPLSLSLRKKYNERLDSSLKRSKNNLETIDYLEDKYDVVE